MVHFPEISHAPSPYSTLHHISRVATSKLVPRNCLRYLQATLRMGVGGLVSEFMWGIVGSEFQFQQTILIFYGTNLHPKKYFRWKTTKSEHHHWIMHVRISLGTKLQLKLTNLVIWTKFVQEEFFWSKTEKVIITIELCIFELV